MRCSASNLTGVERTSGFADMTSIRGSMPSIQSTPAVGSVGSVAGAALAGSFVGVVPVMLPSFHATVPLGAGTSRSARIEKKGTAGATKTSSGGRAALDLFRSHQLLGDGPSGCDAEL